MKRMIFIPAVLLMLQPLLVQGETETLDSTGDVGMYASSKMRAYGIAYYDATQGDLKFFDDMRETSEVVAADGDVGKYCSLAVWSDGENDVVGISYYDETRGDLMFVSGMRDPGSGAMMWNVPVEVDTNGNVGLHTSLSCYPTALGEERYISSPCVPIISYYDQDNADLMFVRALDVNGTTWDTPVRVAQAGDVGKYSSLLGWGNWFTWFFSGIWSGEEEPLPQPLLWLTYYDESNGDLMYVYDHTGNGTSWSTPIAIDTNGNVGLYTSIMVVNTNPAISYYDESSGDLKYVRAQNELGTSWGTPVRVDTNGNVGLYSSLNLVLWSPYALIPQIAYYDQTAGDLKMATANDVHPDMWYFWQANGRFWNPPVVVDSTNDVGRNASLAMMTGWVGYYDATEGDLKRAQAWVDAYLLGTDGSALTNYGPPSVAQGTDYGTRFVGESIVHTFAITNIGPDTMEILGTISNGNGSAAFRVEELPVFVEGGTVSNFNIRFMVWGSGTHTTELAFITSGLMIDDSYIQLKGVAIDSAPEPGPPPVTGKADFQVKWMGTKPKQPKCNSSFTVYVLVQNKGSQKADAGYVQLTVNGVVVGTVKAGSLAKNESKLVQFTGVRNPTGAKPIKITAKADCNNVTGETNEGNNTRTISVKCQ